tara:strand:+ start:431 stop:565 length:135 start_codon:yes stop_codon:yes gene_type:complete
VNATDDPLRRTPLAAARLLHNVMLTVAMPDSGSGPDNALMMPMQ